MESELPKCDICFEAFDITRKCPRILRDCGHSYCSECIKKSLDINQYCVECAFCRTVTYGDKIHDFPKNFYVMKQLNHRILRPSIEEEKQEPQKEMKSKEEKLELKKFEKEPVEEEGLNISKIPKQIIKVSLISLNLGMICGLLIKKSSRKAVYFTLWYVGIYGIVKNLPMLDSLKKLLRSKEFLTSLGLEGILQIMGILSFFIVGKIKRELNQL